MSTLSKPVPAHNDRSTNHRDLLSAGATPLPLGKALASLPETDTRATRSTAQQARTDHCLSSTVSDVLDFFEKCPRCGYAAQATATVRRYDSGRVVTLFHPTCAQPCGWNGTVRITER